MKILIASYSFAIGVYWRDSEVLGVLISFDSGMVIENKTSGWGLIKGFVNCSVFEKKYMTQ